MKVLLLVVMGNGLRTSGFGNREYIEPVACSFVCCCWGFVTRIFILLCEGCGGWYLLFGWGSYVRGGEFVF